MIKKFAGLLGLVAILAVAGCGSGEKSSETASNETAKAKSASESKPKAQQPAAQQKSDKEPDFITVQHILIAFKGTLRGKPVTRSKEEAQKLGEELLQRARAGEDFDALVKEYTDDAHPGIYSMANNGVELDPTKQMYRRGGMVRAFGDVGFPLEVGEVGMAAHDPQTSPFGWHIIKRLE